MKFVRGIKIYPDEVILSALKSSRSVNAARLKVGMTRSAMERRCETGDLAVAFNACLARGEKYRGKPLTCPEVAR